MNTFRVIGFRHDGSRFLAAEAQSHERTVQIKNALIGSDAFSSVTIEHETIHPQSWPGPEQLTGTQRGRG